MKDGGGLSLARKPSKQYLTTYILMEQMPAGTETAHLVNHPPRIVGGGIGAGFANLPPPPLVHLSKLQRLLSNT